MIAAGDPAVVGWCARLKAAVDKAMRDPRVADAAEMRRILAAKPAEGLTGAWFDMVEYASSWVEGIERRAVERLFVPPAAIAALDPGPARVQPWQQRADLA